jgi:hypothetical protein
MRQVHDPANNYNYPHQHPGDIHSRDHDVARFVIPLTFCVGIPLVCGIEKYLDLRTILEWL